jgi:cellulose synthase/poly-beta-1,6-N-acetylglucosamine synthase-like glycosyltransferase
MIWIVIFFFICMLFYAGYLVLNFFYFTFGFSAPKELISGASLPSVTIIIPVRNEASHIGSLLNDILEQNYPKELIQVIVMDDHSSDLTADIASRICEQRAGWKVIPLIKPEGTAYKKAAITQAIGYSDNDIILTTDGDCRVGNKWVYSMMSAFSDLSVGLVSGPVVMWDNGSWFQQFQALEFAGLIAIGGGSMQRNSPNMCNGANLAYRKLVFQEVNGFEGVDHIASGDDELLMHKIYAGSSYRVRFCKSQDAIVQTAPCYTFKQFIHQRIRWVSKSAHYKNRSITLTMSIIYLAIAGIPLMFILGLAGWVPMWISGVFAGIKVLSEFTILFAACSFFGKRYLLRWFLPEQFLHIPYILWAGLAGNIGQYQWKDRLIPK